ncbi:putative extracellular sulfatase Sulf-1 homolog [Ornithodoros turicata]|uniref:putative extracellular sulfatase Sulf-1 homolog n=1 Tax=Ornithodoros turicata TaxID=34597 RepID=UPI00313983B5
MSNKPWLTHQWALVCLFTATLAAAASRRHGQQHLRGSQTSWLDSSLLHVPAQGSTQQVGDQRSWNPQTPRKKDQRMPRVGALPRERRPNIVLILTDDQDIELGSMNFMPKALRILGEGGAHFPNAYVSTPMCCPSRSSMLTGLYAHNHNVHTNNDNCSSPQWQQEFESRSFATYLNNAGYRTAYFGKYLNEYNGNHIPPGWREWAALVRNSRFYNYTVNVNGNKIRHGEDYARDYYPDLVANDSITFLRHSKQLFPHKPVLMVVSFPSPHGPEDSAPQYQHLFHNVTTHRTPSWNYAPNQDKQWLLRYTGQMEPIHIKFTDMLHTKRLQTLQTVDDAVEKLYKELVNLGELNNTYIFYTSDHGYHLGQFGLVKGKSMPFEFDIRVPFYVRGPKVPAGVRIRDIVLNIDLAPTFLDIANIDVPDHMDGKSFYPILSDGLASVMAGNNLGEIKRKKTWRDSFLIERGKVTREHFADGTMKSPKERNLHFKCLSGRYPSPCLRHQRWECTHDGDRWHMRRCSSHLRKDCICESEDAEFGLELDHGSLAHFGLTQELRRRPAESGAPAEGHEFRGWQSTLTAEERKLQRRFLKEHVGKAFRPVFIGSRSRRRIDELPENFDVSDEPALSAFLNATMGDLLAEEAKLFNRSITNPALTKLDDEPSLWERDLEPTVEGAPIRHKQMWRQKKDRINAMIKKLRQKLEELKVLRRRIKKNRVTASGGAGEDKSSECVCSSDGGRPENGQGDSLDSFLPRHGRRRDDQAKRKERKERRKFKFENTTCNLEKMNCFTHNNDHWKTPPLWTNGPFCFCQNANNNTFWCMRTINDTHNFLYCEFITGFITYYDMRNDPYQLRNVVYNLSHDVLGELHSTLAKLKRCKGGRECTIRYRGEGRKTDGLGGTPKSRHDRHWRKTQRS